MATVNTATEKCRNLLVRITDVKNRIEHDRSLDMALGFNPRQLGDVVADLADIVEDLIMNADPLWTKEEA